MKAFESIHYVSECSVVNDVILVFHHESENAMELVVRAIVVI